MSLTVLAQGPKGELPQPKDVERAPDIAAKAAILMDPLTGEILYGKNERERLPMASTTKIMTALVVLERCSLEERVVITEEAARVGESSGWLSPGETLTVEQLLYALLLQSGNDAAVALANHAGGSVRAFVEMMNRRAEELGAWDTQFANPHGLDQEGHFTTAYDLALISSKAMQMDAFRRIVSTRRYEIPWPGHPHPRVYYNKNRLLTSYPHTTGIKTGYTLKAGRCLVASAAKGDMELISVVLHSDDYWNQSELLLEYGFSNFVRLYFRLASLRLPPLKVGNCPSGVGVVTGSDFPVTVRWDRVNDYMFADGYFKTGIPYPARKGDEVGRLRIGRGETEFEVPLFLEGDIPSPGPLKRAWCFVTHTMYLAWKVIKALIPGL